MAKLKDGFYKQTASSIGSDLLVLLAGGGAKPISDFASSFNVKLWGQDFDGSKDVKGNLTLGYNKLYIGDGTDNFYIGWGASNMYCYHNYYGHYFSTKSGEVMSINSSGNVGIGTTNPFERLDVLGKIRSKGLIIHNHEKANHWYYTKIATVYQNQSPNYLNGAMVFYTMYESHEAGSEVERMRISASGAVGIGTSSPSEKLQISGGVFLQEVNNQWITPARVQIGRKDTTVYSDRCCVGTTDGNLHLDAYKGKMIYLNYYQQPGTYGQANTAVIIDTAGNTGIGVTPSYKLHVAGTIYSTGAVYANNFYGYLNGNISGSAASAGYTTRLYANSTTNLTTYPGDYSLAYSRFQADASNIFPCGNNANGVITAHLHAGEYYAQIGLSSNGRMYYRTMLAQTLSSGVGWNQVAWSGESYTKSESDSRYVNVTGDTMTGNLTVPSLNSYYLFKTTDIAEGAANLGTLATAHTITFFRNGIMIPYKMDNANDGGMIRTKGASEDSCVFEMATWDDSGDGETIQFNYYSTTSQLTPTYSNTVPKVSGTLLNSGNWPSYIGGHGYLMNEYTIDATGLDQNTWYPVTMAIGACLNVRIEVRVSLNSGSKPSWSTHSSGFAVRKIWEVNGSGWGTNPVHRTVFVSDYAHASADPVRGMGDMGYSSTEYVYVRGGGRYYFYTSHNITPYLRTSTYVGTADPYYQAISPTTTAPGTIAGFQINRSMYASHFYENSDIKLKENINLISSSDNIPQLKEFNWKSDGKHSYGLIAQELEEMGYSELVEESGDHKTVNYSAALSLIVGKLQVKIKELEKEIEILKNKN